MHEFVHGFLWAINPTAWEMPDFVTPFARALHEGYAIYMARSIMADLDQEGEDYHWGVPSIQPERLGDLWLLHRETVSKLGEDYLPAPNIYPQGKASVDGLDVYNVGMIWLAPCGICAHCWGQVGWIGWRCNPISISTVISPTLSWLRKESWTHMAKAGTMIVSTNAPRFAGHAGDSRRTGDLYVSQSG